MWRFECFSIGGNQKRKKKAKSDPNEMGPRDTGEKTEKKVTEAFISYLSKKQEDKTWDLSGLVPKHENEHD